MKKCSAEVVIVEVVIVIKAFVIESRPKSAAGKHGIYVAFFGSFFFFFPSSCVLACGIFLILDSGPDSRPGTGISDCCWHSCHSTSGVFRMDAEQAVF